MHTDIKDRNYWQLRWELFKQGDSSAFEEIYIEFVDVLFAYGAKITTDRELLKDSIQELFINLHNYRKNLNQPDYTAGLLF